MAKLSSGAKVFLGVVVGTGVLWAGSAFAATGEPPLPPDGSGSGDDSADAQRATAAFAAAVAAAGGIVSGLCTPCIPYVGASATVVGTAWQSLAPRDKARVWRGELK